MDIVLDERLGQVDPSLRRALTLGVIAGAQEMSRFELIVMAAAGGQYPDEPRLLQTRKQLDRMSRGFGAFIVGSAIDVGAPPTRTAGTERKTIAGTVTAQVIIKEPCSTIKPKLSKRRPTSKPAPPVTYNRKSTTAASRGGERDDLSTSATPIQVELAAVFAAGDRPTRPTPGATGGVDLTSSESLVGVDKTTFDDEFLPIGRHDTVERAGPSEAAAGERVNKLHNVPSGVHRRIRCACSSCYA